MVSGDYFRVLGIRPYFGRTFTPVVDKVLDYMTEHKEVDDWTIKQLSSAIGVHTSSIGKAMSYLRVNDKIRATRKVRGGGNAYAVW